MLNSAALEAVDSHTQALAITGDDPWVRWALPTDPPPRMWRGEHALAVERQGGRRHSLTVIPLPGAPDPEAAIEAVIDQVVARGILEDLGVLGMTVPRPYIGALERQVNVAPGGDWEWMWTLDEPDPMPAEERLATLDDVADAAEIAEFSGEHSPTAEGEPGTGLTDLWLGIRGENRSLIAVGAMQRLPSSVPYLAGIVTHTAYRGRGLGAAVTAGLTRAGLADSGVCALSMYSDNPIARHTYEKLGYRTAWAWASRMLRPAA